MDPILVGRVALPVLAVAFAAALVVRPVLRLRREAGVQVVTLHRGGGRGQRLGALAFPAVTLGFGALIAAYAAGGPGAVGAWPTPAAVVGLGVALALAGMGVVAVAQRQMGASLRIGIDERPTPLVESGLFRVVRNPIFSGLGVALAGVVLLVPCAGSALLWLAALGAIAHQTRLEERHLLAAHGDAYRRYAARTGRFLPGVGRLRGAEAREVTE